MVDGDDGLTEEERRIELLREIVDSTTYLLSAVPMPEIEAQSLIESCRRRVLDLFPDGADLFDLIYPSRFRRAMDKAWENFETMSESDPEMPPPMAE